MTESEFQAQVVTLAEANGWEWMHIGRVGKHKANGAKGTLGRGWPDLVLVRGERLMVVELKVEKPLTSEQIDVLAKLSQAVNVAVWRPSDWNLILEVLA